MRLLRIGPAGRERPAMLAADGTLRDISAVLPELDGAALAPDRLADLRARDPADFPVVEGAPRIGPCVGGVGKIICIGRNYAEHAAETGSELPSEPMLFSKAVSAITGPMDPVLIPRGAERVDWEVELAAVIGTEARYVPEAEAMALVAGFCILNDVSERDWQKNRGGQFVKGKSADSFAPFGPWLVTADEVPDCQALRLTLTVDGESRQDGTTSDMVFPVAHLVSYISHFMSLQPGDVIATGTPAGVGLGMDPPTFLREGQVMEATVEGLGRQRNVIGRA
ncbi:fumarylacetoacetate hydrolase family protein [Tropicimonas sp. IMCC6043]|uniref:fumarylacetoacetate hydrolase family protein n=1 Tax=Tropicimonas sp. IMCC6043 TaxID=2510645 RepID=UPI00101BC19F|nr:fumarylacetoacetate hydrolase family protein [Tropicimonas sp. IMCC6043]RYH09490.1 FAA hydrolase family protein [Tropicimonas sp. IMCC6043]